MTETTGDITSLVTNFKVASDIGLDQFRSRLAQLMLAGAEFPGFWSGEIIAPQLPDHEQWSIIQRFNTAQQATSWKQSTVRQEIIAALVAGVSGDKITVDDMPAAKYAGMVIAAIETQVRQERISAFAVWAQKIQAVQAGFTGYRGSYLQPPSFGREGRWVTILRFDSPENLENWFNSSERKELLAEANQFINAVNIKVHTEVFPGWFPIDQATGERPSSWKTAILVILGLYPLLMMQRRFLLPLLAGNNTALVVAFTTIMSVCLVTGITMPILVRSFKWWLLPSKHERTKKTIAGCLLAVFILMLEIAALWHLLPVIPNS